MALLQKESELNEIVQLVGPDALPQKDRVTLESARMLREDFLHKTHSMIQIHTVHQVNNTTCLKQSYFTTQQLNLH